MDLSSPDQNKKKRGRPPNKVAAEAAMDLIKKVEKETDEETLIKEAEEAEFEKYQSTMKAEDARVKLAQEQIKRKLRENLKKKELEDIKKNTLKYLESGSKIKWKAIGAGDTLHGFYKDKLVFEIKKGLAMFNLYLKDKEIIKEQKIRSSYMSCSMTLHKLKNKSEDFIKKIQELKDKSKKLI